MKQTRDVWKKVIAIDMLLLCFSFNVSVVGQMFGSIKAVYGLSLTQGSLLLSMQSIGGLALALMCIFFIDAFNKTKILVLSGLVLCVSLMVVGIVPPLLLLIVLFAVLGFSGGAVNTLTNSVMVETVTGKADKHITFLHMLFSVGAVSAPLLSQIIYNAYGLPGVFLIFGGFALCWGVYAVIAFPDARRQKLKLQSFSLKARLLETAGVLKAPGMREILIIAVLISAWQMSAIYYISSLFTGFSGNAMDGAMALTLLFLGMLVTRLLYSRVADRFSKGRVLMITNMLGALAWIGLFIVPGITAKMALAALACVCCGNNMPIVFSAVCGIAPRQTAAASGFVVLGYYIAILGFIPLIGALGDVMSLEHAMMLCALPLALVIPFAHGLHRKIGGSKAIDTIH